MKRVAAFVIAAAVASAAFSQTSPPDDRRQRAIAELKKRFAAADTNGDGKLTREEANGKMPRVFEHFDEIDKDGHGYVTIDDILAYLASHRGEMKGGVRKPSPQQQP